MVLLKTTNIPFLLGYKESVKVFDGRTTTKFIDLVLDFKSSDYLSDSYHEDLFLQAQYTSRNLE